MGVGASLGYWDGVVDGEVEVLGNSDGKCDGGDEGIVVGSGVFSGLSFLLFLSLAASTGPVRKRVNRRANSIILGCPLEEAIA